MRGITVFAAMLIMLAIADTWFSMRLLAAVRADSNLQVDVHHGLTSMIAEKLASTTAIASNEVDMVEQALNSRYMQWGAVGVMIAMYVWETMRNQPAREQQRNAERKEEREEWINSLKERDTQYLGAITDIRRSVEVHSNMHQQAKETLSVAVQELTSEIRKSR